MWKLAFILFLAPIAIQGAVTKRSAEKEDKSESSNEKVRELEDSAGKKWECGGEEFSKILSYQSIFGDCPQLLTPVNDCCIGHDLCYDQQQGQGHCDRVFCGCLEKATYSSDNSTFVCHTDHSQTFCGLVQDFGDSFYDASANKTEPAKEELAQAVLNKTENANIHVRIYESKTHNAERAIEGLTKLEILN